MDQDFWLPEFQPSPPVPVEEIVSPSQTKQDQWLKKTKVSTTGEGNGYTMNVLVLTSMTRTLHHCSCAVCSLLHNVTLQSSKQMQKLLKNMELVDHGKQGLIMYDKTRPWKRLYVHNCTNPRPLARRMPPVHTGHSEVVDAVYRLKMLHPGQVIQDPKKRSRT